MWREAAKTWGYAFEAITDALHITAAAAFGRREKGGRIVRLGSYVWCPPQPDKREQS